jgi:hypothetical protein
MESSSWACAAATSQPNEINIGNSRLAADRDQKTTARRCILALAKVPDLQAKAASS